MSRRQIMTILLAMALLLTSCSRQVPKGDDASRDSNAFTVAVLSDSEWYMEDPDWYSIFMAQTKWIAQNINKHKIKMVLHQGDVVNTASDVAQWKRAQAGINVIDSSGVPFLIAVGESDYSRPVRDSSQFNTYLGIKRYSDKPWFGGAYEPGKADNVYAIIDAGEEQFLFLTLEYAPRKGVLQWANTVLDANPKANVIIITHAFLNDKAERIVTNGVTPFLTAELGTDANDGQGMWDLLVTKHDNIKLILCGHTSYTGLGLRKMVTALRRSDKGARGKLVHQVLSNYQAMHNGGDGYLRLLTLSPADRTITVQTYSPTLNTYNTDKNQQFTLRY